MRPFVLPSDDDGKAAGCVLWGGQRRGAERAHGGCVKVEIGEARDVPTTMGSESPHSARWEQEGWLPKTEGTSLRSPGGSCWNDLPGLQCPCPGPSQASDRGGTLTTGPGVRVCLSPGITAHVAVDVPGAEGSKDERNPS